MIGKQYKDVATLPTKVGKQKNNVSGVHDLDSTLGLFLLLAFQDDLEAVVSSRGSVLGMFS